MKRMINYPLFHDSVEITHALVAVASQENHDGPEYDLMMGAAEYIRVLESVIDLLVNGRDEDQFMNYEAWFDQQDDPGISEQALQIYNELYQ